MDMSGTRKRKRVVLTLENKLQIGKRIREGERVNLIAQEFNVGISTVRDIARSHDQMVRLLSTNAQPRGMALSERKSLKQAPNKELDEAVYKWFREKRTEGVIITGPLVLAKAKYLHKKLQMIDTFCASTGWLANFRKRHGIVMVGDCLEIVRDLALVEDDAALSLADWQEITGSPIPTKGQRGRKRRRAASSSPFEGVTVTMDNDDTFSILGEESMPSASNIEVDDEHDNDEESNSAPVVWCKTEIVDDMPMTDEKSTNEDNDADEIDAENARVTISSADVEDESDDDARLITRKGQPKDFVKRKGRLDSQSSDDEAEVLKNTDQDELVATTDYSSTFHGNITPEEALDAADTLLEYLESETKTRVYDIYDVQRIRDRLLSIVKLKES